MSEDDRKPSNTVKKGIDKVKNTITNEEWDEESQRYRDKNSKKYTRGAE
ncbi:hypothetical protein [Salinigranum salinum]|nr:hypothetical protein [Salinigranum salinum]